MWRKRRHERKCMWCYRPIDRKHPKTFIETSQAAYHVTYSYYYHVQCWIRKHDYENMKKYKDRLVNLHRL